jgi:mRNA interferase MazF
MKHGEVWWVLFDPAVGGEIRKTRPAVIVSNDASNKALNRVQVIPLTSSTEKIYPCETLVTVRGTVSKAMADQLTTVRKLRLKEFIALLAAEDMAAVESIIALQLGLHYT